MPAMRILSLDLPVVEDSLNPQMRIEKTREDAENIWWKLDPVPSLEDLVVPIVRFLGC